MTNASQETKAAKGQCGEPVPPAPPPLPETAVALAARAKDLVALRDVVVDAATVSAGLWLSYLIVLFYLLIAAGGVTHKDLFLENSVKLPFLNIDLPLKGFFWLGPTLFLILHAYVLLHFALLADKVGVFDAELHAQIPDDDQDTRTSLRRQLPSNIFVQLLAGPRAVRHGIIGITLRAIAWISLLIGPVMLLVFCELQFLPYHHAWITWWQRVTVLLDIGLIWTFWPAIAHGRTVSEGWRALRIGLSLLLASLGALLTRIIHQSWRTWCKPLIGHRIRLRDQNPADFGAHARQG